MIESFWTQKRYPEIIDIVSDLVDPNNYIDNDERLTLFVLIYKKGINASLSLLERNEVVDEKTLTGIDIILKYFPLKPCLWLESDFFVPTVAWIKRLADSNLCEEKEIIIKDIFHHYYQFCSIVMNSYSKKESGETNPLFEDVKIGLDILLGGG